MKRHKGKVRWSSVVPRRGAPIESFTVRIYATGLARVSEDLVAARSPKLMYEVSVDGVRGYIRLVPAREKTPRTVHAWYSNAWARSPIISLRGALRSCGLQPQSVAGVYPAVRNRDGAIVLALHLRAHRAGSHTSRRRRR